MIGGLQVGLFLGASCLGETSCHVLRTLEQLGRETHVARNERLQSAASQEVKPANNHVSELAPLS